MRCRGGALIGMVDTAELPSNDAPTRNGTGLYVVGGRQRGPQGMRELDDRWYGYGQGVIVDVSDGLAETTLVYESAPDTCGPEDPVLFKSATVAGDRLYACTQTELLVYRYPELELLHHVSNRLLNDVHHIIPGPLHGADRGETLVAAVSGLDAVLELDLDGGVVGGWSVGGGDLHGRLDDGHDYRKDCDLKPHAYHPNHLFRLDGRVWATRFETRDAVDVLDQSRRIAIDRERCHDGVVHGDAIYFTTVDGHVVEVDRATLAVRAEHRLTGRRTDALLGWCRGLTFVGDHAVVGFSRIRHTRFRSSLSWIRNGFTASEPTRIAVYDPRTWTLVDEVDLEPAGCNAVFSILDRPSTAGAVTP